MSDTHALHGELDVPAGDLLIHASDVTMFSRSLSAIEDYNAWLSSLPHRHKIVVPGNHDSFLEADLSRRSLLSNATVLIDEEIAIDGLRIWGSPVTPLYGGAFGLSSPADRKRHWNWIPEGIHVLVTHGPAHGILDQATPGGEHQGDPELLEAIDRVQPLLHVCGHVHGGYGTVVREETTHVNVALLGLGGGIEHQPVSFRMGRR